MCYSKLCLRAVSQVTEKRKTWEILGESQNWWGQSLVPNIPFRNNFLVIEIRNLIIYFVPDCRYEPFHPKNEGGEHKNRSTAMLVI